VFALHMTDRQISVARRFQEEHEARVSEEVEKRVEALHRSVAARDDSGFVARAEWLIDVLGVDFYYLYTHGAIYQASDLPWFPTVLSQYLRSDHRAELIGRASVTWKQQFVVSLEAVAVARGHIDMYPSDGEDVYVIGEDFEESPLNKLAERRRRQGRDLKVIIVARDSQTGTGKTTLAVQLAQQWSREWTADLAANTADKYMRVFERAPRESVILADEIGTMFDNRRSMSGSNVDASQMWDIMRKWEKWTIATLPGASSLDKRFLQKADVLIVVRERGVGRVLKLKEKDVEGDLYTQGMCTVRWGPIDEDPEYRRVEQMKDELMERKIGQFLGDDRGEGDDEDELDEKQIRDQFIQQIYEGGFTQPEIADALDLSQSTVSRIVSD